MMRRFFSAAVSLAAAVVLLASLWAPAMAARPTGMEGLDNESGVNRIDRRQFPRARWLWTPTATPWCRRRKKNSRASAPEREPTAAMASPSRRNAPCLTPIRAMTRCGHFNKP